jgi:hypothetical protein
MSAELYGDWDKALKIFNNMKGLSTSDMAYEIIDTGDEIAERIKEYIMNQELALLPLVESYRDRKVAEGYDPRILIRTGEFVDNIEVTDVDESDNTAMVFVSVKDGVGQTGINLKELAEYLEYGTSRMPARYPFTLSWEKMRTEIKRNVARRMMVMLEGTIK